MGRGGRQPVPRREAPRELVGPREANPRANQGSHDAERAHRVARVRGQRPLYVRRLPAPVESPGVLRDGSRPAHPVAVDRLRARVHDDAAGDPHRRHDDGLRDRAGDCPGGQVPDAGRHRLRDAVRIDDPAAALAGRHDHERPLWELPRYRPVDPAVLAAVHPQLLLRQGDDAAAARRVAGVHHQPPFDGRAGAHAGATVARRAHGLPRGRAAAQHRVPARGADRGSDRHHLDAPASRGRRPDTADPGVCPHDDGQAAGGAVRQEGQEEGSDPEGVRPRRVVREAPGSHPRVGDGHRDDARRRGVQRRRRARPVRPGRGAREGAAARRVGSARPRHPGRRGEARRNRAAARLVRRGRRRYQAGEPGRTAPRLRPGANAREEPRHGDRHEEDRPRARAPAGKSGARRRPRRADRIGRGLGDRAEGAARRVRPLQEQMGRAEQPGEPAGVRTRPRVRAPTTP